MDPSDSGRTRQTCRAEAAAVPGCDSGPGGRLVFVVRELTAALRRHRSRRSR